MYESNGEGRQREAFQEVTNRIRSALAKAWAKAFGCLDAPFEIVFGHRNC